MNLTTDEIKNYSKKLLKSRFRILTNYEFYGSLLMNTKFSLDESCETAYTNGKTIAFDPKFLDSLTEYELDFVMMHEIMHICLKHCFRGEKKNNFLFNIACDIVVNSNIINSCKLNVKKLSKGALGEIMHLTPKNDEGYLYTAEEVYNMLHNVNSSTIDDHSHWVGDDENLDKATNELIDEWNNLIINTVESCGNKAHGCVPFGAGRQYDLLTKSIVNWKQLLNDFLTFEITDYSFSPPDKRFDEFFLPDFNEEEKTKVKVVALVDSSGSISNKELGDFYSELLGMIGSLNLELFLYFFDEDLYGPHQCFSIDEVLDVKPKGGGGTDVACYFNNLEKRIEEIDGRPDAIIIFTDGYLDFYDEKIADDMPVLWIINNDHITPDWGIVAKLLK